MIYDQLLDRQEIIQTIEKTLGTKIITFYTNPKNYDGLINNSTIQDIQTALNRMNELDPVSIIIHSFGGETQAGFRIASILKNLPKTVNVIIPEESLSAATMIMLSADKITFHKNAYCSPVEPQYIHQGHLVSALDLMESSDEVIVSKAKRTVEQSNEYLKLICEGSMSATKLKKLSTRFLLKDKKHASHNSPIYYNELKKLGLNVEEKSQIDVQALHNLYKRHNFHETDPSIIIEYLSGSLEIDESS